VSVVLAPEFGRGKKWKVNLDVRRDRPARSRTSCSGRWPWARPPPCTPPPSTRSPPPPRSLRRATSPPRPAPTAHGASQSEGSGSSGTKSTGAAVVVGVGRPARTATGARTRSEQTTRPRSATETRAPAIATQLSAWLPTPPSYPTRGSSSHFLAVAAATSRVSPSPMAARLDGFWCGSLLA
jgi:hypothetical protein